jgi:hypothetical protein
MGRGRGRKVNKWIQEAIKRPGRVRRYMMRKYGKKAFTKKGTVKVAYLKRAVKEVKDRSLKSALLLAIRLKKMGRGE